MVMDQEESKKLQAILKKHHKSEILRERFNNKKIFQMECCVENEYYYYIYILAEDEIDAKNIADSDAVSDVLEWADEDTDKEDEWGLDKWNTTVDYRVVKSIENVSDFFELDNWRYDIPYGGDNLQVDDYMQIIKEIDEMIEPLFNPDQLLLNLRIELSE